jgi:hypothetical protein
VLQGGGQLPPPQVHEPDGVRGGDLTLPVAELLVDRERGLLEPEPVRQPPRLRVGLAEALQHPRLTVALAELPGGAEPDGAGGDPGVDLVAARVHREQHRGEQPREVGHQHLVREVHRRQQVVLLQHEPGVRRRVVAEGRRVTDGLGQR